MSAADHEDGVCLGVWGSCEVCDALMDEARARRIKLEMSRCQVCGGRPDGRTQKYCARCDDKMDQIHNERIYDWAAVRDDRD